MPEHRRKFSPQFKAEAVQMVIETGKPIAGAARGLGYPRREPGELGERVAAGASRAGPALVPGGVRVKELGEGELPTADGACYLRSASACP
jgi:transposase-like protein